MKKYLAAALIMSVSTGVMAANCEKNPTHPSCVGGDAHHAVTVKFRSIGCLLFSHGESLSRGPTVSLARAIFQTSYNTLKW